MHGAAAGRQHRVDDEHVRVVQPRRQALVVLEGLVRLLVAIEAEMADARVREQAQEGLDHAEPGAQHRHDGDLLGKPAAGRPLERGLDLDGLDGQLARRLHGEDRRGLEQRLTEVPVAGRASRDSVRRR